MRRETRLLLALGAIAIVGVGSLSYLADQYQKRATMPAPAAEAGDARARRLVAAFLAIGNVPAASPEMLRTVGLTREEYDTVRAAAATWARGEKGPDPALEAALAARVDQLRAAGIAR